MGTAWYQYSVVPTPRLQSCIRAVEQRVAIAEVDGEGGVILDTQKRQIIRA